MLFGAKKVWKESKEICDDSVKLTVGLGLLTQNPLILAFGVLGSMEAYISAFTALAFLQFMRGYCASKGYSRLKMSLIGAGLSLFTGAIAIASVCVVEGVDVVLSRFSGLEGALVCIVYVAAFSLTYCFASKNNPEL